MKLSDDCFPVFGSYLGGSYFSFLPPFDGVSLLLYMISLLIDSNASATPNPVRADVSKNFMPFA